MTPELIIPDRVRDLTSVPRRIPIDIEGSVVFEIPLTIWGTFNPKESNTASELGEGWLKKVRKATADDLAAEIEQLGGPYAFAWLSISALMLSAPHPHDPDRVLDWLEALPQQRLRRWILGYSCSDGDQALIEQAATGDIDAAITLLGEKAEKMPGALDFMRWMLSTEGLSVRYATALKRFRAEVFSEFEEEFAGAVSRAAAARRATPLRGNAKEVVEEVTSGIDFEIPLGVTRVVLVPSVLTRPLSLIDSFRGTLVVYYGIADEFIDSDPEAPPSWLVRTYKALSDERRLRILRRLADGPATLDDLSEMLGLSKSTVHHHITLLRGAGLIRVHMSSDEDSFGRKRFSIRERSLSDANGFLDSYLRATNEEMSDVH
ncbi:MAG TPA: winged helix-turn-helix domain-containing protein [Acidimicrobiia bacterium]|jgi:DNA-binding transcriptional ArsR family regulator|nr:winged helix-turn-helix domain-containing protein [Acidimicrobiia bacterium]